MGPNAITSATQVANGTYNGGSTAPKALKAGVNAFVHFDVSTALDAFRPIVKKAEPTADFPELPAGVEFGMTLGSAANSLSMELYGSIGAALMYLNKSQDVPEKVAPAAAPVAAEPAKAAAPAPATK